jgi:peptidoglycan/LPS O-acetylase OafA/YrhL
VALIEFRDCIQPLRVLSRAAMKIITTVACATAAVLGLVIFFTNQNIFYCFGGALVAGAACCAIYSVMAQRGRS